MFVNYKHLYRIRSLIIIEVIIMFTQYHGITGKLYLRNAEKFEYNSKHPNHCVAYMQIFIGKSLVGTIRVWRGKYGVDLDLPDRSGFVQLMNGLDENYALSGMKRHVRDSLILFFNEEEVKYETYLDDLIIKMSIRNSSIKRSQEYEKSHNKCFNESSKSAHAIKNFFSFGKTIKVGDYGKSTPRVKFFMRLRVAFAKPGPNSIIGFKRDNEIYEWPNTRINRFLNAEWYFPYTMYKDYTTGKCWSVKKFIRNRIQSIRNRFQYVRSYMHCKLRH